MRCSARARGAISLKPTLANSWSPPSRPCPSTSPFHPQSVRVVLQGYLNPEPQPSPETDPARTRNFQLIAEGKGTKEVAEILGISVKTAETHRTNLMRKLSLHSAADVVRYAIRNQIVQP